MHPPFLTPEQAALFLMRARLVRSRRELQSLIAEVCQHGGAFDPDAAHLVWRVERTATRCAGIPRDHVQ